MKSEVFLFYKFIDNLNITYQIKLMKFILEQQCNTHSSFENILLKPLVTEIIHEELPELSEKYIHNLSSMKINKVESQGRSPEFKFHVDIKNVKI